MLGSTVGSLENGKYTATNLNLFGNTLDNGKVDKYTYFTGKPNVEGLGYAFLFRNYRPELAKWQTQDPMSFVLTEPGFNDKDVSLASRLGYPDGWNNLAYCNNWVTNCIDWQGTATHYYTGYTSDITVYLYSGNPNTKTDPGIIFSNWVDPFPQMARDQISAAVTASISGLTAETILTNAGISYTSIGNITTTYTTSRGDYSGSDGNFMVYTMIAHVTYSIRYEE